MCGYKAATVGMSLARNLSEGCPDLHICRLSRETSCKAINYSYCFDKCHQGSFGTIYVTDRFGLQDERLKLNAEHQAAL